MKHPLTGYSHLPLVNSLMKLVTKDNPDGGLEDTDLISLENQAWKTICRGTRLN